MIEKIVIAIPARLASKRLPNKVLKDINGKPMLRRVIEQCCLSTEKSQKFLSVQTQKK